MINIHQYGLNPSALKGIPLTTFLILLSLFIFFAIYFFYQWYKNFRNARNIEDLPTTKIRSAAQGYVEIQGTQKYIADNPTIAPLSLLPCTWYRYQIEHAVKDRWFVIEKGESTQPFIIEDETGECIIDPTNAQISTTLIECWKGFKRYPQGQPKNFIWRLLGAFGRYRYYEWRMDEGMFLYAAGNFSTQEEINYLKREGQNQTAPFVLSSNSHKQLIFRYKMNALVWFIGYVAMLVIIGWLLLARF